MGLLKLVSASTLLFFSSHHTVAHAKNFLPLSQHAWRESAQIIQAIKTHPFNQKLKEGTLERDKFAYYIEQDVHYLKIYSQVNAIIAARIAPKYANTFLKSAHYSANEEQTIVHEFFNYKLNLAKTGLIAPATLRYNQHLLTIARQEPVAVAVAAILPCQWIYFDLGTSLARHTKPGNPYAPWFNTYSSNASKAAVEQLIRIFDELASTQTDEIKQRMIKVFKESSQLELDFWDDAYQKKSAPVASNQATPSAPDKYPQQTTKEADVLRHN